MSRTNTSPDQIGEDCLTSSPLWDLQTVGASFDRDCEHSHCSSVVLRPHKPVWVGWQPWFYLRLKGLWLCWVVRGGIWCPVRLSAVAHRLTRLRILTLEPDAQRLTNRDIVRKWFTVSVRSSCLCFQLFRIETFSLLPDDQTDGRDLARQGQPGHLRLHPLPQQGFVVITKRSGTGTGGGGGGFKNVFQIVIVIQVQTADEDRLLGAAQLAFDKVIVGAAACFQRQSAISPELALAAEAKRSLHAGDQQGSANWSQKRNTGQHRRGGMFAALHKQIAPGLAAESLQGVELLKHPFSAVTATGLRTFVQPLLAPAFGV